ncbi:uncharacterized protein EKO05_0007213 [Ascochyta rabiei]|uniref:uncharacterized protein n=1 Tax=Didymella rabiei TaxID=5454 RepID=UPI001900815D|nr:uncharacterized protein EKO05_0007213 [Ascochyta rabiei]UPX16830.1 hypothetical protein EKO05_0007213 [Ascochyta rabiei]
MLVTVPRVALAFLITPPKLLRQNPALGNPALNSPANDESPLLECLQVAPPIAIPPATCHQTLMVHTFALSYGQPFVGQYYPPNCRYNRVVFNLTVTSAGRQFDRLALMFFDDVEIFRTSTAEPTHNGIVWKYAKDMSSYLALFKQPHKIIFDLGNLVDDTYTGAWQTTLTATYFTADDLLVPADTIFPVSARRSSADRPSHFTLPASRAIDALKIPQNARRAVFSISACGQAAEEFWWSNVLSSDSQVFGDDDVLYGHSPFRELQLFIDDQLAGVAWPFPVIFSGGVVPAFWRPLVGIDTFDLVEDEIDVTPFLPRLNDNEDHVFEIRVVGIEDNGHGHGELTQSIESNWVVTGKLFIWLDADSSIVTGTSHTIQRPIPSISVFSSAVKDVVDSLQYSVYVSRFIHISSTLETSKGPEEVSWTQNLVYFNHGTLTGKGNDQIVWQNTSGNNTSPSSTYFKSFAYPLWVTSSYRAPPSGGFAIDATIRRAKNIEQTGELAFHDGWKPMASKYAIYNGTRLGNSQNGTASYISTPAQKISHGFGSMEQHYVLSGIDGVCEPTVHNDEVLYQQGILAVNGSVVAGGEASEDQTTGL